jgi:hypothetical protein
MVQKYPKSNANLGLIINNCIDYVRHVKKKFQKLV